MNKIVTVSITDNEGNIHSWKVEDGYYKIRSITKKGEPYQQAIDIHGTLPTQPDVKD